MREIVATRALLISGRGSMLTQATSNNKVRSPRERIVTGGSVVTAQTVALPVPAGWAEPASRLRAAGRWLWSIALSPCLVFLVLYPVAMLLLGALTNTNPVVDGFGAFDLSLENFLAVLANPNVHLALMNSLVACTGGTVLAVHRACILLDRRAHQHALAGASSPRQA